MKKILILIVLLLLVAGGYFVFTTDNAAHRYVSDQWTKLNNTLQIDSNIAWMREGGRKKIPKVLKPDAYHELDEYARNTPKEYEKDVKTLAHYLIIPAHTQLEKARVLFTWVALNIHYDDDGFNSGKLSEGSTGSTLENKKAVCEGFSNIMADLCRAAGLEAVKVSGYAKGYGYEPGTKFTKSDHAWNAIKIGDRWGLFDPTWAGGYGENKEGKLHSIMEFDPYWFDVNPKEFIFTHLPEQEKWQLTDHHITKTEYETFPKLDATFFKLGFNTDQVFADATNSWVKEFVETYNVKFPFRVVEGPYKRNIKRGSETAFVITSDYAEEIDIIDNNVWHEFTKEGNTFKLDYTSSGNEFEICAKINWWDRKFSTITKYTVTEGDGLTALNAN